MSLCNPPPSWTIVPLDLTGPTGQTGPLAAGPQGPTGPLPAVLRSVIVMAAVGPTITTQPVGFSAVGGPPQVVSLAATGTAPLSYQWQWSTNGTTGWTNYVDGGGPYPCSGSQTTAITLLNNSKNQYVRCIVTNLVGSVTSNAVWCSWRGQ